MPKFVVNGRKQLKGSVKVGGSKNAALPIICAALLTDQESVLKNVPDIADIHALIRIVEALGAKVEFEKNTLKIDPKKLTPAKLPNDLIRKMRASILILGSLLPRFGELKMDFPGGCVLGKRPVDAHTFAFKELGCKIIDEEQALHIKVKKLKGKKFTLPELSVTATENAVMMASVAEGKSEIRLAAAEPHVQDLCRFLKKMGAKISGIGTNTITVNGVKKLKGATHTITGDYLEAGTYAIIGVATKSDLKVTGIDPDHLDSVLQKFKEMGANYSTGKNYIHVHPTKSLKAVKLLRTAVYPSFPTDLQAPFAVLLTQAKGVSKVFETMFEGRLNYLFELENMGAHVEFMNPHQALIIGPTKLAARPISSYDIRAGAAMVVAALIAEGRTEISNINYIDRGYEHLHEKLQAIGADIERIEPKKGDS